MRGLIHLLPGVDEFEHKLLDAAEPFVLEAAGFYSDVAEVPAFPAIAGYVLVALREGKAPAVFVGMCVEPFTAVGQGVGIFYVAKVYGGA